MKARGIPINGAYMNDNDNTTYNMCCRYFKRLTVVYKALGFDSQTVAGKRENGWWTRQAVMRRLRERCDTGQGLSYRAIVRSEGGLIVAARKHFGSYDAAMRSVGLNPDKYRIFKRRNHPYPTQSSVIDEICRRKFVGLTLSYSGVVRGENRDKSLVMRGRKLFETWDKALIAAGVVSADDLKK